LFSIIAVGAFGVRLGYHQATKRIDELMMNLLFHESAISLSTRIKLIEKFRSGQTEKGMDHLEKLIDVELATLAMYEKVPKNKRDALIIESIRAAKEYRKKYPQHQIQGNVQNSVKRALELAD
jgi:hypothetical protein